MSYKNVFIICHVGNIKVTITKKAPEVLANRVTTALARK